MRLKNKALSFALSIQRRNSTVTLPSWIDLRFGNGCPLCAPRPAVDEYRYFVSKLSVSTLYLTRDQAYRGTCAVVYDPAHVTRPSELSEVDWRRYPALSFRSTMGPPCLDNIAR